MTLPNPQIHHPSHGGPSGGPSGGPAGPTWVRDSGGVPGSLFFEGTPPNHPLEGPHHHEGPNGGPTSLWDTFDTRTCRVCGCTDFAACLDENNQACWWIEPDLCSSCRAHAESCS